jgi:hypothetical protein
LHDLWAFKLTCAGKQGMQGAYNKNWKRNTGLALAAMGVSVAYVFNLSRRLEQRYFIVLYARASCLLIAGCGTSLSCHLNSKLVALVYFRIL